MQEILFVLWFFAPAGIANSAPVFANKVPLLKNLGSPIDFGKKFRGKRIFGDHKTFRGFLSGVIVALLVGLIQMFLFKNFNFFREISGDINYGSYSNLGLSAALGFGALFGDAVKSFFKRQVAVQSGKSWFPYDQIDYIVGGIVFSLPFVSLKISEYILMAIVWFVIHPIATFIGWLLRLKDSPI